MEWYWTLAIIFSAFVVLMAVGIPIAFAFLTINVVCCYIFWNGPAGITQLVLSISSSVTHFTIVSVPLFVLMGEVMFRSGIATKMMDVLDSWFGRVPGRLALMSVAGGTVFAGLTGSGSAATAMLGKLLVPDMERRGYHRSMALGPIMASGGLAIMIPPSALGVLLAALAQFPVGDFLVAIIVPGLLMSVAYAGYIILRCYLNPSLAPAYAVESRPLRERLINAAIYIFPLFFIMFVVVGLIFLGIATPTESAALGALATFLLAALYRGLSIPMIRESLLSSMKITVMLLMIITGSTAFSQILAYTGATSGLADLATSAPVAPILVIIIMQIILIFLGMFMEPLSIMMLTVPIYFPVIQAFEYDPIWFGAIMLLNMEMATISPPFGLNLFVMRGVAPRGVTMGHVYAASVPFLVLDLVVMALLLAFPGLVLWLPTLIAR
ncbi:MAG: TRAP transporter large permease subunit [Rhodospirillaceae bacterium]|nr:TRAP transporter large permease subunit [Rhodospirillaceae bacterium]